jgi:hypothetical protein
MSGSTNRQKNRQEKGRCQLRDLGPLYIEHKASVYSFHGPGASLGRPCCTLRRFLRGTTSSGCARSYFLLLAPLLVQSKHRKQALDSPFTKQIQRHVNRLLLEYIYIYIHKKTKKKLTS